MATLLKNNDTLNNWTVLTLSAHESPENARLPAGPVLVPVAVWQARREDLIRREWEHGVPYGLWLGPTDNIATVAADLDDFSVIGVSAPANEGRAYLTAPLLRSRYGYKGELRTLNGLDDFSASAQDAANQSHAKALHAAVA